MGAITGTPRGRPRRRQPKPGDRVSLGLRVTPELKAALDRAAADSGRSQSQEAEFRLEHSFRSQGFLVDALELAYGRKLGAMLVLMGQLMRDAGGEAALHAGARTEEIDGWPGSQFAFDEAVQSLGIFLVGIRPTEPIELPKPPPTVDPEFARAQLSQLGQHKAEDFLKEIKAGSSERFRQRSLQWAAEIFKPLVRVKK